MAEYFTGLRERARSGLGAVIGPSSGVVLGGVGSGGFFDALPALQPYVDLGAFSGGLLGLMAYYALARE